MTRPVPVDEIARRLTATSLGALNRIELPLPDGTGSTWVIELADEDLVPAWREARGALFDLDLHPVGVTNWGAGDWIDADLFDRFHYGPGDTAPASLIQRAQTLTVADALARFSNRNSWARENWDSVIDEHIGAAERLVHARPDPSIISGIDVGDEVQLERSLMVWEESVRPSDPSESNESFCWYEPRPHDPVGLVLLPLAEACHASAYLPFYGAEGEGRHEALIVLFQEWQRRFGAQLVANWGTMLQFVVPNPPAALEDAFELAAQQVAVAPCTTVLPGESIRSLARHLRQGDQWFLHERP